MLNSFVYLDLLFSDGSSAKIIVKDEGAFKLLQMQVGQPEWTLEQIEESKRRAAKRSELVRSKKKKDAELEAEIRPKAALAGWICFVLVVMLCGAFLYVTDADGVLLGFAIIMGLPSAAILGVLAKKVTYAWIKSNR